MANRMWAAGLVPVVLLCAGCGGGGDSGTLAPGGSGGPAGGGTLAPRVTSTGFNATEDMDFGGQLAASDDSGTALNWTRSSEPTHGTLVTFTPGGAFTYRPNANFAGTDSFGVSVANGRGGTATGTITLSVANVNDPPTANDDFLEVAAADTGALGVLGNDTDPDGGTPTVSIIDTFPVGTAAANADGTVRMNLPAGFTGTVGFDYRITDAAGASATARAVVFVGVPGYRLAVSAADASGRRDLYLSDLSKLRRLTTTTASDQPIDNVAFSFDGSTVAYTRSNRDPVDMVSRQASQRLYLQRTAPGSVAVAIPAPAGLEFTTAQLPASLPIPLLQPMALSGDGRWLAVVLRPAGVVSNGGPASLYVVDTQSPATLTRVAASSAAAWLPVFAIRSSRLLFVASSQGLGGDGVVMSVDAAAAAGAPTLVSAAEATGMVRTGIAPARDGSRYVLLGTRAGVPEISLVRSDTPGNETLLSDFVPGEASRGVAFSTDPALSFVAYAAVAQATPTNARVVRVATDGSAARVSKTFNSEPQITGLTGSLSADGSHLIVRRTLGGALSPTAPNATLVEQQLTPSFSETPLTLLPYTSAFYDPSGTRVAVTGASVPPLVYVRGSFGSPITVGPGLPGTASSSAIYGWISNAASDGSLYLANFAAPEAWFSVNAPIPELTGVTGVATVLMNP